MPPSRNAGFSVREPFESRVVADALVALELDAGHRDRLGLERPDAHAFAARSCDPSAKASCSSREIENSSAKISAPSPSATVHSFGIVGFTIRHPSAEFHICSCVVGNGRDGLSTPTARGSSTRHRRR